MYVFPYMEICTNSEHCPCDSCARLWKSEQILNTVSYRKKRRKASSKGWGGISRQVVQVNLSQRNGFKSDMMSMMHINLAQSLHRRTRGAVTHKLEQRFPFMASCVDAVAAFQQSSSVHRISCTSHVVAKAGVSLLAKPSRSNFAGATMDTNFQHGHREFSRGPVTDKDVRMCE